ncbi:hypothetical protein [Vibrio natriegens]|uniref:hypothetical protein n=1 Tax=Vibrio natriegens TaxID=691 RepID=UPI000803CEEC|nr:hypothetical protein [Vibrio natriegens]ANQ16958.1 hypothetical protein BA891_06900 [Vibrio natriegens]
MNILFLHTLDSNTELFKPLAAEKFPQHNISHDVQESFLTDIRSNGQNKLSTQIIHQYLKDKLINGFDYIICTCSTLGSVVDSFPNDKVFRVDKPMAKICAQYESILVAVTLESTIGPTRALLTSQAPETKFKFTLIDGAWELYEQGKFESFNDCIANDINQTLQREQNYQVVLLAQASMINSASLITDTIPVLTSPDNCLAYLADHLKETP